MIQDTEATVRRNVLLLTILVICLLAICLLQESHVILADPTTQSPTVSLQFTKILNIPAVNSQYGKIPVIWVGWNPVAINFAAVYEFGDSKNPIHILDGSTGSKMLDLDSLESVVNSTFAWSSDGKYIAAILGYSNNIKIWDLTGNSSPIVVNRQGEHQPYDIYWSPDGLKLAETEYIAGPNGDDGHRVLFIWGTKTGKLLSSHPDTAIGSWSPDGKKMVVLVGTDYDQSLEIVDSDTFQVLFTFPQTPEEKAAGTTPGDSNYVIWTSDSRQVIGTTCEEGTGACTLWSWNAQTGQVENWFGVFGLNFRPEFAEINGSGTLLAITDSTISGVSFWDVQSGQLLNSLETETGNTSLSWNHTQDLLVISNLDGTIQEWKVQTKKHHT